MTLGMMRSGSPRVRPWPYDAVLNTATGTALGVMLLNGRPGDPKMVGEQPDPLSAASPSEMSYSAQNPILESTTVYDDLHMGFGQKVQIGQHDRRYRYASGADCSIAGQMILGPYINSVTPTNALDTTNGISHFFELGGVAYALNGRYVKERTADTAAGWGTTEKDFGAAKAALDVIVLTQNASGSTRYAYVAMGDSEFFYRFDGTTWDQHASLYRRAFALASTKLYAGRDVNMLCQVDIASDPWTAGNWNDVGRVGEYGDVINRLIRHPAGFLLVMTTRGIHALDEEGNDVDLTGNEFTNATSNGKYTWATASHVHTTYDGQHFRIDAEGSLEQIGPERFAGNTGPVSGYIVGGCDTPYGMYAGLYNPDLSDSHLMKFGAYDLRDDEDPKRIDAWHGSLAGVDIDSSGDERTVTGQQTDTFSARTIQTMSRTSLGAAASHEFLRIGCSDGTIQWFTLPCKPNPVGCSSYKYADGSTSRAAVIKMPYWHGIFPKDEKVIRAVTCTGTTLAVATAVAETFGAGTVGSGGNYGAYPTDGTFLADTVPGKRSPVARTVTLGDFFLRLTNVDGTATATPVVTGLAIHYRVNPPLQQVFQLHIICENGLVRRDGSIMRLGADQIRTAIKTHLADTNGIKIALPDQQDITCQLTQYREQFLQDERTKQWRAVITVVAAQSDPNESGGVSATGVLS